MKSVAGVIAACVAGILLVVALSALRMTPDVQGLAQSSVDARGWIVATGIVVALGLVYFAPSLLALHRGKQNRLAIFLLNVFVGWTLVGWVVAIVWAAMVDRPTE